MSEMEKEKKQKKKSSGFKLKREHWFIIVIVIVVIACIVIGILITNKGKNPASGEGQNQEQQGSGEENPNGLIDFGNKENVDITDNTKTNNSEALKKDRTFQGMQVKDITLVAQNGITNFTATIENTTAKDFPDSNIVIVFKNKDGSEYQRLESRIGEIKAGGTASINAGIIADLSNAYDFTIELAQ